MSETSANDQVSILVDADELDFLAFLTGPRSLPTHDNRLYIANTRVKIALLGLAGGQLIVRMPRPPDYDPAKVAMQFRDAPEAARAKVRHAVDAILDRPGWLPDESIAFLLI